MRFTDYFLLRLLFVVIFKLAGILLYIVLALGCLLLLPFGIRVNPGHPGQRIPRLHAHRYRARAARQASYRRR